MHRWYSTIICAATSRIRLGRPIVPVSKPGYGARATLLAGVLVAMVAAGTAQAGPGAKIYQELREKEQFYPDERWQQYVTDIGERLLANSSHAGANYTFTVLDNPAVNAFATEDAFIFVNRGLISFMRSEDELAGVIGHEIGHVIGRHGKKRSRNRFLGEIGGWLGALATGTSTVWDLTNTLTATLQSGYGRANELEADEYGAEFLARSGYNPHAMIDSIQALKDHELYMKAVKKQPSVYHGLFSSHPKNDKRLHELVQQAQHLVPDELAEPVGDFWSMVDGLVYGDEAAAGLVKDGSYYNGSLRVVISFPKGWGVTNTPTEVMSRAAGGTTDAYIGVQRQPPPSTNQSPEEYVTETLKRDDVVNGESTEINGSAAYVGDIKVAGGNAQARKIAVVYHGNSVYVFQGEVGTSGDAEKFKQQFADTLQSIRTMTPADLRLANNQRIKVIAAKPGDTFKSLAQGISLAGPAEETLRVINGHHPNGEPRAGDYIKIVQ